MGRNAIQFQKGLSVPEFQALYGTEAQCEDALAQKEKVQMDDSHLGGERPGGKAGRGSENKVPIVAAISLNAAGHPIQAKISPVTGFTSEVSGDIKN
ncbi:MAG: hypothetical protein ACK55X_10235 [Synechococcaceae cyanobacterium]|jgi:hypothetical protein